VAFDRVAVARWVAKGHRHSGRRLGAARAYARGAIAFRNPGSMLRAAKMLIDPRAGERRYLPPPEARPDWLDLYVPAPSGTPD
jgi:hypothetical protein